MSADLERDPEQDPEALEEELEEQLEEDDGEAETIEELDLGENIESTKEIRAREAIKAEKRHLYQVGPEAEGLADGAPEQVRMDEPLEGAGIGEDFEPAHPARDLDTAELNAAARAGTEILQEEGEQEGEEIEAVTRLSGEPESDEEAEVAWSGTVVIDEALENLEEEDE